MNAQNLKNSILQLAIQGKLVEQREEEGTAKELLGKIEVEKQQLIKEGKIKLQKPWSAIKEDEIPFDIPINWEWIRLGDLIKISSGKGLTSKQMKEGDIPVFGGNGITGYHNVGNVDKKTVVIGRVGYYCGSIHITPKNAWITDNAFITTYPESHIDRMYLVYILRHLNIGRDNNATAQPVVSGKKIYPILFPLPPLEEQRRIVAKIEEFMPYVEKYDIAYSEVEELNKKFPEDMQKSILQYAIHGKLVEQREEDGTAEELYKQIHEEKKKLIEEGKIRKPKALAEITEDEVPFDIPVNWKWVRIGEIFNLQAGKNITSHNIFESQSEEKNYPCYGGNGLRGYVSTFNREGKYALIGRQGALCGNINYAKEKFYATEHAVVVDHFELTDVMWSGYFLKVLNLNQYATATAQPGLAVSNIVKVLIPLPPLEEQKRIVAKIEELIPYSKQLLKY